MVHGLITGQRGVRELVVLCACLMLSTASAADERATVLLLESLRSGSALERAEAAQSLAYERDPRIAPALVEALRDKDRFVRWRAAEALAKQEHAAAAPELERLATTDSDATVRDKAASALGDIKRTPAYAVYALRASPDERERQRVASRLAFGLDSPELIPALIAAVADSSATVRIAAAESLGIRKAPNAVPALVELLRTTARSEPSVAYAAAEALGKIGDARAVVPLVAALGVEGPVVGTALKALTALKDPRSVTGIVELITRRPFPSYSYEAALALKAIGQVGLDALVTALEARPPLPDEQRRSIARAIRFAQDPRIEDGVLRVLVDSDPTVRGELATALGRMKSRRAVGPLLRFANEGDQASIVALGEIGDRRATASLVRILANPTWIGTHDVAVDALGRMGDPAGADALFARLAATRNQTVHYDHLRAAQALCAIGGPRVKTVLLDALRSADSVATRGAHRCLIGYGVPGTEARIAAVLTQDTPFSDDAFAQACFSSGNASLKAAADTWAQKHGRKLSDWTPKPLRWGEDPG